VVRLVAKPQSLAATRQLASQLRDRRTLGLDRAVLAHFALATAVGNGHYRPPLMHIQTHKSDSIVHDPSPMHEALRNKMFECGMFP
jgi:hypothetical protein